jgi:hypothetical protein
MEAYYEHGDTFSGSIIAENFFSIWATVSLLKKTPLHVTTWAK